MNVISKKTLVLFYEKHADSRVALEAWYAEARKAQWQTPDDIKREYASASFFAGQQGCF